MTQQFSTNPEPKPEKNFPPEALSWLNFVEQRSLFPLHNHEIIAQSAEEARQLSCALPLILTLCPAIENLNRPAETGQTRKLMPLLQDNPKVLNFVEEFVSFVVATKDILGEAPEILLIFSDVLEPGAEQMFANTHKAEEITNQSLKTLRHLFFLIDQANPGLFQEKSIKVPKIHKQSELMAEARKIRLNPVRLIENVEFEELDPNSPAHTTFERHLKLTRDDPSFIPTGWQNRTGREAIHNRIRFMVAQCWVDGVVLPKLMEHLFVKRFPNKMPTPIFVTSSPRLAGATLQAEGFNLGAQHPEVVGILSEIKGVITPFRNVGNWTQK